MDISNLWNYYSNPNLVINGIDNRMVFSLIDFHINNLTQNANKRMVTCNTKRQHTVPSFVIETFSKKYKDVLKIEKLEPSDGRTLGLENSKYLSAVHNIYDSDETNQEKFIECFLAASEDKTAPIINKISENGYITSLSERITLAVYVYLQLVRSLNSKAIFEYLKKQSEEQAEEISTLFPNNKDSIFSQIKSLIPERFDQYIKDLIDVDMIKFIYFRQWEHILIQNGLLLNIDNPIAVYNEDAENIYELTNQSLAVFDYMFIPLNRNYMLKINNSMCNDIRPHYKTKEQEHALQYLYIINARDGVKLYKHPEDNLLVDITKLKADFMK